MAITETAALYNPSVGGPSELAIKQAWWRQVFSTNTFSGFPRIKMINWFEWRKFESETGCIIDWTVTSNPELAGAFVSELPLDRLIFADELERLYPN